MLLVRDDIYVKRIKRIMVALDKSAAAEYTLDLALYLLKDYPEAELILARVNPDLKPDLLPLSRQEIENNPVLAPAIAKAKRYGINYRSIVTGGKPGEKICELADEYSVDLLMIGLFIQKCGCLMILVFILMQNYVLLIILICGDLLKWSLFLNFKLKKLN